MEMVAVAEHVPLEASARIVCWPGAAFAGTANVTVKSLAAVAVAISVSSKKIVTGPVG